ncbi:MAG TPA: diphosphomevalonate decarboxylase [Anaerolineaceae bacterium]|nr:diphosphomevalonate decarboxylase [Anaerolineaceae bacterium]
MHTTAIAHPNIAFIKYWGNQDDALRIPMNGSLSMNLQALTTTTSVEFCEDLKQDDLVIDGQSASPEVLQRVSTFLDIIRAQMPDQHLKAIVISNNNFPMSTGIASSAAAFAALAAAASQAAGLDLDETTLSRLARRGSGSACRSIPSGFVEWQAGTCDEDSYAHSIAAPDHWALVDLIAVVSSTPKQVGSSAGHALAASSPIQKARVADCPRRLQICRTAILQRDFVTFAEIVEQDSNLMHAVMMSSTPSLLYWEPATIAIMQQVLKWRSEGLQVCYTIDAGSNVHLLCPQQDADDVEAQLQSMESIQSIYRSSVGDGVRLV